MKYPTLKRFMELNNYTDKVKALKLLRKILKRERQYPEFENAVDIVTNNTCQLINDFAKSIKSEMPYKSQYLLEEVIKKLQERV
jgi:hypothetical protein